MSKDTSHLIANLTLSGEDIQVGIYSHDQGDSVWFKTEENAEPIYLRVTETSLLIAALQVAQDRIEGQEV